jgi:hypothetical protein
MFLKLGFESWNSCFDFLNPEDAMKTTAVQVSVMVFWNNGRSVPSKIYFSHINMDLTNMKWRRVLNIP